MVAVADVDPFRKFIPGGSEVLRYSHAPQHEEGEVPEDLGVLFLPAPVEFVGGLGHYPRYHLAQLELQLPQSASRARVPWTKNHSPVPYSTILPLRSSYWKWASSVGEPQRAQR